MKFPTTGSIPLTWNQIIDNARSISNSETKEKLISSVMFLQQELGDKFLTTAIENKIDYISNFKFLLYWNSSSVIALATHIQSIQSSIGFVGIFNVFKSLTQPHRFHESITLFETGYLLRRNFELHYEPEIADFNKKPDLKIVSLKNSTTTYVEISELRESKVSADASEISSLFMQYLLNMRYRAFGKFHSSISILNALQIVEEIQLEIDQNLDKHGLYHFQIPGVIDFVAYEPQMKSEAKKLADELKIIFDVFAGPPIEKSEWVRVFNKIFREQQQLPTSCENLIVIWANDAMIEAGYRQIETTPILEFCLQKYAHISGIVVISTHPNESFNFNDNAAHVSLFKNALGTIYHYTYAFRDMSSDLKSEVLECLAY